MNSLRGNHNVVAAVVLALAQSDASAQAQLQVLDPIPSQPVAAALKALSRQTGLQIVYMSKVADGLRSSAVPGGLSVAEALQILLSETGLQFEFLSERTVTIQARSGADANAAETKSMELAEVIVVGSRLGVREEGATPVRTVSREQIQRSGDTSVMDVLGDLSEVSFRSSTGGAQAGNGGGYGSSTVNLRGLPGATALVLLNGRRLNPSAGQVAGGLFNLNLLPLAAVERIEVLPAGSSAIYGGDALSGVVNIVTTKDRDGADLSVRYGHADGFDDRKASVFLGRTYGHGSLMATAFYSKENELEFSERSLTATQDFTRYGGRALYLPIASPGNIYSLSGGNLPGLSAPVAAIPEGNTGNGLTPQSFAATAGQQHRTNKYLSGTGFNAPAENYGALLSGQVEIGAGIELFGDFLHSQRRAGLVQTPLFVYGQFGSVAVPAANPFNPFGVAVGLNYTFEGAGQQERWAEQRYQRLTSGLRGSLHSFDWTVAATRTRSRDDQEEITLDTAAVVARLADPNPTTAFNPFEHRTWSRAEVAPFLSRSVLSPAADYTLIDASIKGDMLDLPAGPLTALLGAEYGDDEITFVQRLVGGVVSSIDARRTSYSVFSEVRVPLIDGAEPGDADRLAMSGALRYDDYRDVGAELSHQLGLEARPMRDLLLRGAYSTAFKPPTLTQLYTPVTTVQSLVTDSARGGESYPTVAGTGGNLDLGPITGETHSFGFVYTPHWLPGTELTLSRWSLQIDNYTTSIGLTAILGNEDLFAKYISRAAPSQSDLQSGYAGRITRIFYGTVNYGTYDLAGYDISGRWTGTLAGGRIHRIAECDACHPLRRRHGAGCTDVGSPGQGLGRRLRARVERQCRSRMGGPRCCSVAQRSLHRRLRGLRRDYPSDRQLLDLRHECAVRPA